VVAYCGGGILRPPFLSEAKYVINAHAGPLPEVRGMNAAEWALLLGLPAEVSIHQIDAGIDTGPVIARVAYDRSASRSVESLRERAVLAGAVGLVDAIVSREFEIPVDSHGVPPLGRQCFIMAPVLVDAIDAELAKPDRQGAP
jgi:methionyl-tRNA formyltransferase